MKNTLNKLEKLLETGGLKKDICLLVSGGISLVLSLLNSKLNFIVLPFNIAWVAILLCGIPIILEAVIGLVTRFDIKADVLVALALVSAVCIHEDFAAGEVAFIMQLGALLEDLTVAKARAGIEKLVHLSPRTARILYDGNEVIVAAEEVKVGDILRVLPGETIPADGIITYGQTSINQALMTGESIPVDKSTGDEVSSGTVNQFGAFEMKATKVGEDSSIQRMINLVQSADADKAKIVRLADRWATWVVLIALSASVLTWLFTGQIIRAVTILVVFCPCALVLSTPTAIMAAIGNATKHSFLIREGDALERLAGVSKIILDKTGTLTFGIPQVIKTQTFGKLSEDELLSYTAKAEKLSEHPLGKAVVHYYEKKYERKIQAADDFFMIPGKGVRAEIAGKSVLAGNLLLMRENGIEVDDNLNSCNQPNVTLIFVAVENHFEGIIFLSDVIRAESKALIKSLKKLSVPPVLLTGDNEETAAGVADELEITEYYSACLPEDKLKHIAALQEKNEKVCMIGDGINDAPALKKADVGIAMGKTGSGIAIDAADITVINDEIKQLPHLLALSKQMMKTIKLNLIFSMALNFIAIALAVTGILNPVAGALVHNAGSVAVIINSSLLLKWASRS